MILSEQACRKGRMPTQRKLMLHTTFRDYFPHTSRYAWATIAKSKNVPVNVILDAFGHDSIATPQIYLASIDTSTIERVNGLIINDL